MRALVFRIPSGGPEDVTGLSKLLDGASLAAEEIVCILGKTEGNGCVNDFTRGYSVLAHALLLADRLGVDPEAVQDLVALVMSGGTEGILSPHHTVFARCSAAEASTGSQSGQKRLAIGTASTRGFHPEELGRRAQIEETAAAVRTAMDDAQITDPDDVHFVQIKCPLLTSRQVSEARARGTTVATDETYKSMALSRGASAIGAALALGEIDGHDAKDERVCRDWTLYSSVASVSAGVELSRNEVILLGNSPAWTGDLVIGHSVMRDAIDSAAVRAALRAAGCCDEGALPTPADLDRVVNVLAKAEADPSGLVRGRRHTMLDDSDINSTRHARGAVGATVASVVGDPMVYVSGGAEHQGPSGGGPVAVVARTSDATTG